MSKKLMLEDLARSGLSGADATKLKTTVLTKAAAKKAVGKQAIGYKIPYFDVAGKKVDFYRVRFLEPVKKMGGSKLIRYSQPSGTGCRLYFPPLMDWKSVAKDVDKPIAITEGEKKAAKGCRAGLPTIGLGGVWSFRSKKELKSLIDDFKDVDWVKRKVLLIFDSDLADNPNVAKALNTLAKELTKEGALVTLAYLPEDSYGEKQGLDDFLLNHSLQDLLEIDNEPYDLSYRFWEMNEEVAYIEDSGMYYIMQVDRQFSRTNLLQGKFAPRKHEVTAADGSIKLVNTFKEWTEWPQRRVHGSVVYRPGDSQTTEDGKLNVWQGWGVEPKRGDIKPWNELLDYIFKENRQLREWFVQWLAYPIQNPGTKLNTSVLIHGLHHGTGKSFIGYIMGDIYGSNFSVARQEDIHSPFNGWLINKQFVMGEEITGNDRRTDADKIKNIITQERVTVNVKYQPTYDYRDCVNYLFTSNHPDALFLEDHDRRFMIHEVEGSPMESYKVQDNWRAEGGAAHLFYHLLNNVDVSNFDPKGHAPESLAKSEMMALAKSDIDMFASELREYPDSVLVNNGVAVERDLFTVQELVELFDPEGSRKTTWIAMSKALSRAGFRRMPVTNTENGAKRLWAARNQDEWHRAGHKARADGYVKGETLGHAEPKVVSIRGGKWKRSR